MRTHHIALGVASLLAVSQAFADYSFSFTSRARHDGVGASAGQSQGFSFGGAASGSSGGDAAANSPGSFPADDWFGAYSALAGALFSPGGTGIVGTSSPDPCLDPAQSVLNASDIMACSSAFDAPTSARGKVIVSNPPANWPPIASGGAGNGTIGPFSGPGSQHNDSHHDNPASSPPIATGGAGNGTTGPFSGPGSQHNDSHHDHSASSPPITTGGAGNPLFEDPTSGGTIGPFSGPGSYYDDPANWPPIVTGGTGNSPLGDPTYGAGSDPIETSFTSGPPLEVTTGSAAAAPEPGTLALVGLALLGLAILPLRTRH